MTYEVCFVSYKIKLYFSCLYTQMSFLEELLHFQIWQISELMYTHVLVHTLFQFIVFTEKKIWVECAWFSITSQYTMRSSKVQYKNKQKYPNFINLKFLHLWKWHHVLMKTYIFIQSAETFCYNYNAIFNEFSFCICWDYSV